jgi:hypothetical protein
MYLSRRGGIGRWWSITREMKWHLADNKENSLSCLKPVQISSPRKEITRSSSITNVFRFPTRFHSSEHMSFEKDTLCTLSRNCRPLHSGYDQVLLLAERHFMRPSYVTLPATGKGVNLNHYSRWTGCSGELSSHNVTMDSSIRFLTGMYSGEKENRCYWNSDQSTNP